MAMAGRVTTFLLGARTADELPFRTALQRRTDLRIATDDGSAGASRFCAGLFEGGHLASYRPDLRLRTGVDDESGARPAHCPGVLDRTYFSLHRYMKCGVGVCGSCCIDPEGVCVCREGPVFSGERLIQSEFGNYSRNASGQRVHLGRR